MTRQLSPSEIRRIQSALPNEFKKYFNAPLNPWQGIALDASVIIINPPAAIHQGLQEHPAALKVYENLIADNELRVQTYCVSPLKRNFSPFGYNKLKALAFAQAVEQKFLTPLEQLLIETCGRDEWVESQLSYVAVGRQRLSLLTQLAKNAHPLIEPLAAHASIFSEPPLLHEAEENWSTLCSLLYPLRDECFRWLDAPLMRSYLATADALLGNFYYQRVLRTATKEKAALVLWEDSVARAGAALEASLMLWESEVSP